MPIFYSGPKVQENTGSKMLNFNINYIPSLLPKKVVGLVFCFGFLFVHLFVFLFFNKGKYLKVVVGTQFANTVSKEFCSVMVEDIKDINYLQNEKWIYRGYKNQ